MSTGKPIPTPWKHRWRRFRYSWMPVLCFTATIAVTLWLWDNQGRMANAVGEVEVVRLDVAAKTAGKLVPLPELPGGQWTLFDLVQENEVIARLDDSEVQASLRTLRAVLDQLSEEVIAAESRTALELANLEIENVQEFNRLTWQIEQNDLDILDRTVVLEADKVELRRLQNQLDLLKPAHGDGVVPDLQFQDLELQRDRIKARIVENTNAVNRAIERKDAAERRLQELPPLEMPELTKLLAPIQASVRAQEARIAELQVQIAALEIRSPISGTICGIHCRPGQNVQAGQPILTIAADNTGYVVSYVRQTDRIHPSKGMQVALRLRMPGSRPVTAEIERVGPQIEEVPPHQRRDPSVLEWGLPVRIRLPSELPVRPGELVDITFESRTTEDSGAG